MNPEVRHIEVARWTVVSTRAFDDVLARLEGVVGRPDLAAFWKRMGAAATLPELEKTVATAVGPSGFMEFMRFDLGRVLRLESGRADKPRILRLLVGNPLVMKEMTKHAPDAGSYAPVTILIDERGDGVHLSYDRMAAFLAPYGSAEALAVARDLDARIEALLIKAASA